MNMIVELTNEPIKITKMSCTSKLLRVLKPDCDILFIFFRFQVTWKHNILHFWPFKLHVELLDNKEIKTCKQ